MHFDRDRSLLLDRLKSARLLLTCTGKKGVLSCFSSNDIAMDTMVANMGVEDEIGDGFAPEQCLFEKKPLNFALEEPTLFEFLGEVQKKVKSL